MLKQLIIAIFSLILSMSTALGDTSLTAYFKNDSVNGLMISDAYETHNMGFIYKFGANYVGIDLGIVTPDMHIYINQYREANRSFGEIISLEFGQQIGRNENTTIFGKVSGSGEFGLDNTQEFAHRLLSLQHVSDINQLVRMPNQFWLGMGFEHNTPAPFQSLYTDHVISVTPYLGTDRASVKSELQFYLPYGGLDLSSSVSLEYVFYDQVVSALPVSASHRKLIPELRVGASYDFGNLSLFVSDSFGLPTIQKDKRVFGVLRAGITYNF